MDKCMICKRELTSDETGLHKKLFNRGASQFMCINCSSEYLEVPKELLQSKIEQFKEMGCTLFEENGV